MDALQVIASATQIVSSMVGAVGALEQASRDLDEAPKRIRSLENFVCDLESLTRRIKQKHMYKLQNPQLDHQIQSLNGLIERLHPNIQKARRILSRSRIKKLAKVVWNSVAGDPLGKIMKTIRDDLNWWLESQKLTEQVENVIESTARSIPVRLKINMDQGYPISSKCKFVRRLLEKEDSHKVILIVGLSGIGKSCLARQVASNPPSKFVDGAVELGFGQWCSKAACNGSKAEYQKRLARKFCKFFVQIGYWKKIEDNSGDLEYVCCLLQEALYGKSILILLDDVWEQDIVERFAKLYDNDCRYLVTTRNESVCEITETEKVELSKDDVREISKAVLLYHSLLNDEELPGVAESLLERCGHHPLTVAVMGRTLRKETRTDKWEKAITNLSTYATCAPGPVSYANEKEAENTVTIFGSFEFSLEAMPEDSRRLFIALSALSWAEPVPEGCLEAIWSALGQESLFPLVVCKLVEGSLLMKTDSYPSYQAHDMVTLYLDSKVNDSIDILLRSDSMPEGAACISPWLLIFGKETIKEVAGQRIKIVLSVLEEKQTFITLEAIIQAFMASISISELDASRASFSSILGPRIANLISADSQDLIAVSAEAITSIFSKSDYTDYFPSLETIDAVDKLARILENCEDPTIQSNILNVLAKLAEFGTPDTVDKVLQSIPMNRLVDLLHPNAEEWHEIVFSILMSLTKAGKSKAVDRMFSFEIDRSLIKLLEVGSEVAQHHAIVTLKAFYELGGPPANGSLRPRTLNLLPWQVRLGLEQFVMSNQNLPLSPKPQNFEDLIHMMLDSDNKRVLEAMQDIIPTIEKAGDSEIRDMILRSPIVKRLSELLQIGRPEQNSLRSASAFALMKLACSGGESCIKKFLEYDIIPDLIKMMQCNVPELQDSAYMALHQMLFGNGGFLILNRILQMGLMERLVRSFESKSVKTREVNILCVLDIVELGNKACIEQIFSLQVVEKLVRIEKGGGGSGESIAGFLRGIDKCKPLSKAERKIMKQQVIRKVRAALKGHKLEAQILAAVDFCVSEGSRGSSSGGSGSGSSRQRK